MLVHSPSPIDDALVARLQDIGPVAHIVAPGSYHYFHVAGWQDAYPEATTWICPGVERKCPDLDFDWFLSDHAPDVWSGELEQALVRRLTATRRYSSDPADPVEFTRRFDRFYSRFARVYDTLVKRGPIWRSWLAHALPHVRGPRVLEVSCGTGYLLTQYAGRVEASAVDLNARMVEITNKNLGRAGLAADVRQADVQAGGFGGWRSKAGCRPRSGGGHRSQDTRARRCRAHGA